ncbi:hypothetical protein FQN50_009660 [Emmonsiellopsis sp. PD_5]|nr:hypothetical protein FQN50_009660 [Emmonsiellopsis sp. PD_5]
MRIWNLPLGGTASFWLPLEEISNWDDFTYANILRDYGDILNTEGEDLAWPSPLRGLDSVIVDETTVSAVLLKSNHIIVCCALEKAQALSNERVVTLALGVHAPVENARPDWAGVATDAGHPRKNHVPGDSKVSGKWNSAMRNLAGTQGVEFNKPLMQVLHYANLVGSAFGYVISDKETMCIRRRGSEFEGSPLARNRPRRSAPVEIQITPPRPQQRLPREPQSPSPSPRATLHPSHAVTPTRGPATRSGSHRRISVASATSLLSEMSIDSPENIRSSPSAYSDKGNPDINEVVEIVCIPWENHGPGKLTVNLALFYIHMLAGYDNKPRSSYSPIRRTPAPVEPNTTTSAA